MTQETIKFWDLPDHENIIEEGFPLQFDGDKTDLRLFADPYTRWSAKGKREYKKAEKAINNIEYKGNGWLIYAIYDVSGYDYWVKQMEETNYLLLIIRFDSENLLVSEIPALKNALITALSDAEQIGLTYNYDPSPYAND